MSGHTPGPWFAAKTPFDITVSSPGHWIAGVHVYADDEGASMADATLIAAAPDLIEAAKHAAMEWRLHGQLTDSCRVLEAAIAKAEGR